MGLCSKLYFILSHHICNRKLTIRIPTGDSKQVNTVIKAIEFFSKQNTTSYNRHQEISEECPESLSQSAR